jgi:hypothetical protein
MNILKKNKRGFLLAEETLKIIVAVICIIFLVYILVAVYNNHSADKKIEQAKEVFLGTGEGDVPGIEAIISSLGEGESETKDIINPQGWHLYSFVGEEKPNFCLNQKCLCICENSLIEQLNSQAKKCDEKGACLTVPSLAVAEIDLKIKGTRNALFIEIKRQNGRIFVEEAR